MKKTAVVILVLLVANQLFAQEEKLPLDGKNEVKFNVGNVLLGATELSYERLIGDNDMGAGLNFAYRLLNDPMPYLFYAMPYYRLYFGKSRFCGFVETHVAFVRMENKEYIDYNEDAYVTNPKNYVGIGVSGGFKWATRRGIMGEVYLGLGRTATNENGSSNSMVYPHVGVTLGKRF
ncbi:MAG: hypothetical protein LBK47_00230 [Prevotellaceae bacterium]|jgi:hypothetical protein|nr:hypothetical protein [Prevotellaceae bacterium]